MQQVAPPLGEARSDFEIFAALAARLDVGNEFSEGRDEFGWLEHMYTKWRATLPADADPGIDFADFWRAGRIDLRTEPVEHVLYEQFRADPDQLPLSTPSGRIELFSQTIDSFGYADCPGHPTWIPPDDRDPAFPLILVANNPATRLHS